AAWVKPAKENLPVTVQTVTTKLGVKGVFLILSVGLFILSALGLTFSDLSLSDFGLACFAFAFLYDLLRH
ncbi:MAG: hypothetical protein ACXWPJ_06795, partial [Candidatus Limnocylindrales bacterium]